MSAAAFVFPEVPDWPRPATSKTRINTYRTCPLRYGFQYVSRQAREFVLAAELFGRAMHQAVAHYYRGRQQGVIVTHSVLAEEFRLAFAAEIEKTEAPLRYANGYDESSMRSLGIELLSIFLRDVRPRRIVAVEQRFAVPLGEPAAGVTAILIGILDLVEVDEDGDAIVVELKTGPGRISDRQAFEQLDGRVYAYALTQLGMRKPGESMLTRYDVLIKRKHPALAQTYAAQTDGRIRAFADWVQPVLEGIRRERFSPKRGWYCAHCPFQNRCQVKPLCSLPAVNRQSLAGSGVPLINPAVYATRAAAPASAAVLGARQ